MEQHTRLCSLQLIEVVSLTYLIKLRPILSVKFVLLFGNIMFSCPRDALTYLMESVMWNTLKIPLDKQQKLYNIPFYSPSGDIVLLKVTYVPSRVRDKFHISQSVVLEPGQASGPETIYRSPPRDITQMKLRGTGPQAQVYVGTTTGIYRVPTSQCGDYTDCCSCIEARDPYCAFDSTLLRCVAVEDGNRGSGSLVQDVVNGNVTMCAVLPVAGTSPPTPSPTSAGEEVTTSPAGGDGESTSGKLI